MVRNMKAIVCNKCQKVLENEEEFFYLFRKPTNKRLRLEKCFADHFCQDCYNKFIEMKI